MGPCRRSTPGAFGDWNCPGWSPISPAALAGGGSRGSGLAWRWLALRIGVVHVRLLARPGCWRRRPRTTAERQLGVSHPIPIVSRSGRSGRPHLRVRPRHRASNRTTIQRRGCSAATRRGLCRATAAPVLVPARQPGWLGSPSAAGSAGSLGTARLPPWWRRIGSITGRSPTVHAVGGSFIRRSPAAWWRRRAERRDTNRPHPALACGFHPQHWQGSRLWHAELHPARQPPAAGGAAPAALAVVTGPPAPASRRRRALRQVAGRCGRRRSAPAGKPEDPRSRAHRRIP
jgi:hypothetical protein